MMSGDNGSMVALIRHAHRQMTYIRATRGLYATPGHWARTCREGIITEIRRSPVAGKVNYSQARLAARWAVADARRNVHPDRAQRLDREVESTGVSRADLRAARWESYRQGQHAASIRQDPSAVGAFTGAAIPVAACLAVSANLYDNAYNWDEQTHDELAATDEQWHDPVGDLDALSETSLIPSEESLPEGISENFDPEAFLPKDMHLASIDEQLENVAADMESGNMPETSPAFSASPTPDLGTGTDTSPGVGI